MEIPFEKHVLPNGLRVVLHEDRSDPVVTVHVIYRVGSSREEEGRTGFAHLFEHMLFQGSQNVPGGDHFRLVQEAGGTLNGTTGEDRTNYFETLPSNHLELALWLESDRMGFLLPAMTQEKLDNQRDVVKNERRQNYDERPYGLVRETLMANLFAPGHPLSWIPIGSMEDIDAAGLGDVERFFQRWYGPQNATLVVAGDVARGEALAAAERWFGDLPAGEVQPAPEARPAGLESERRVVLEDRVQIPQLTLAWPTVPAMHPDEAALNLMTDVLSANRSAILDEALMVREELASSVTIAHRALETGGSLVLHLRPHPGVALATLEERVDGLVRGLVEGGVEGLRLARMRARREGAVLRGLDTVASRAATLAHYDAQCGDPGGLAAELERHARVTPEQVVDVAQRYLLDRPRVVLSTVPEGHGDLVA